MGIFKNITKTLKRAAPVIGSAIGMYYGGSFGAALGSGIGSLAAGRRPEDALRDAAITGATAYALGGKDFGRRGEFSTADSPLFGRKPVGANVSDSSQYGFEAAGLYGPPAPIKTTGNAQSFFTSPTGIATLGLGAAALGGLGEEKPMIGSRRPDPVGKSRLGIGLIGDKAYNLDDEEERKQYFEDLRKRQGVEPTKFAAEGGMAEMDMKLPDLKDTRNFAEKMTTGQLKFNTKAGKEGYTEAEIRQIQNELAKRTRPTNKGISVMFPIDPSRLMSTFMDGGEVEGPGTGTSDSVPARLSDGEFVLTAKAVRGAGGGDRDLGAARMYDMMSKLERVA